MYDQNDKQTLVEYIASLLDEDKKLIDDLPLEVEELLMLDGDDFSRLTDKRLSDLNQQQQERRVTIIRRISALQAWERVWEVATTVTTINSAIAIERQKNKSKNQSQNQSLEQRNSSGSKRKENMLNV
jgi:hypothetical protein